MRTFALIGVAVAALLPQCAYAADAASVARDLRALQSALEEGKSAEARSLPAGWEIDTDGKRYWIPSEPLRELLESVKRYPSQAPASLDRAKAWLEEVALQLEAYSSAAGQVPANAKSKLDGILAQPEFAGVGPPSQWEQLRDRVIAWIQQKIREWFEVVAQHPTASRVLFWTVLAAAVGLLGFWLFRLWTGDERMQRLAPAPGERPLRAWEEWLADARQAAERGDARQAIHCAYWAGITRLQASGALPRDRTRTPREYLRAVTAPKPGAVGAPDVRPPLAALTNRLERFWYARRAASADDFRDSLNDLEALGCKVE
jgi:hypothetical protein